ncbi:hypothetical protein AALP_AA1G082200 [Arabis alpina]|uniref:Cation/H+ exchanger domain-containing protein n=1 Tax=Arabis alpina TaxID=50452 RepID=A0A087HLW5_ARAAL|nr:hypothetical protein AALP_AA1G082200 [Arabis alpina]
MIAGVIIGVTMDAGMALRVGKKYTVIGVATMVIPLICGQILYRWRILRGNGIFELAYFTYAVEKKHIRPEVFTIMATFILLNSIFIPMALELVRDQTKRAAQQDLFNF